MQCEKCNYVLGPFDDICPRCGANTAKQLAESSFFDDDETVTKITQAPPPATNPFPADGHAMVMQNGTQYGPYTLAQINSFCTSGSLVAIDKLQTDSREWVELRKVQGVIFPKKAAAVDYTFPTSYQGNIRYNEILSEDTEGTRIRIENNAAIALGILSFLFPILGGALWLFLKNRNSPLTEKVGQWAYYGVVFYLTFFASMRLFWR